MGKGKNIGPPMPKDCSEELFQPAIWICHSQFAIHNLHRIEEMSSQMSLVADTEALCHACDMEHEWSPVALLLSRVNVKSDLDAFIAI